MADFMISYASTDADLARQIARNLEAAGRTVWMDDAGASEDIRHLVGLPGGQGHWSVISTAMDEAGTILVVETPAWRSRAYCQKELAHARRQGKRLAVVLGPTETESVLPEAVVTVRPDAIDSLIEALTPGDDLAGAHARLLRDMATPRRRRWLLVRADREQAHDAELITMTPLLPFGLDVSAELAQYCQDLRRRARARRRARNAVAVGVVTALIAAGAIALVSRQTARASEATAREQANYAEALLLAQQAEQEITTARALALAERAVALHDSAATRATLSRIQATATYLLTTATPTGVSMQVAISRDGAIALASRADAVLVVDPQKGTVRSIAVPATLGRRLGVTPDGQHGYAVARSGDLICVDIAAETAHMTNVRDIVDLQVTGDGTLWWLTSDGALHRSASCPVAADETTVVATGLIGATAIGVEPDAGVAITVTGENHVLGFRLPAVAATISPLWSVDIAAIPQDGVGSDTGAHSDRARPSVQFCGEVAHILTGVEYSLPASTHVATTLDGELLGPRTSHVLMNGVGCGPGDTAWASPAITPRAVPLPATAYYPLDVVTAADRGSANVIANSADGSHTVLAHADGRIQVLNNATTPWGTDVGTAAVAVPIRDGVVTVDLDGAARLRRGSTTTPLGNLGGEPAPLTVALPDRAVVASGAQVFAINAQGVRELGVAPGTVTTLAASLAGDRIIAGSDEGWVAIGTDDGTVTPLVVPELADGDQVFGVRLDGSLALWNTHHGKLILADLSGTVRQTVDLNAAGGNVATFNGEHAIVALGSDGLLRLFSPTLEPLRTVMFGSGALTIHPTPDGRVALIGLNDFSVWAVDLLTLQALGQVQFRSPDLRLVVPSADGTTVIRLDVVRSDNSYGAKLEVLPMPGSVLPDSERRAARVG